MQFGCKLLCFVAIPMGDRVGAKLNPTRRAKALQRRERLQAFITPRIGRAILLELDTIRGRTDWEIVTHYLPRIEQDEPIARFLFNTQGYLSQYFAKDPRQQPVRHPILGAAANQRYPVDATKIRAQLRPALRSDSFSSSQTQSHIDPRLVRSPSVVERQSLHPKQRLEIPREKAPRAVVHQPREEIRIKRPESPSLQLTSSPSAATSSSDENFQPGIINFRSTPRPEIRERTGTVLDPRMVPVEGAVQLEEDISTLTLADQQQSVDYDPETVDTNVIEYVPQSVKQDPRSSPIQSLNKDLECLGSESSSDNPAADSRQIKTPTAGRALPPKS
ncbi:hypothetical protein QAD02_012274 [Eretmocerus hayati]|uniref:Uncharacterized protein n=1 Tax=Eretmocerus hayati TaxID=131215 RepID=A0ACC2NZB3_9HYME|nr:hypothetical protein QAD02_012274 [Eretmocerus hayati]